MKQTEKRTFKDQLYEQFARIGKALANPHRLELLEVLAQCERTVEALAAETGTTVANASQHLQVLRAAEEYLAGHLPHARSIPVTELEARLSELPADKEIVAYCRGPYCVFADEAVALLRQRGYHAFRLHEGLPDWQLLGLPIAVGKE